jgi:hypothetical protein
MAAGKSMWPASVRPHTGLTAGLGLEVGLTHNWSVKAEGFFNDYGNQPYALIGTNTAVSTGAVQFGVHYGFGLTNTAYCFWIGAAAPNSEPGRPEPPAVPRWRD